MVVCCTILGMGLGVVFCSLFVSFAFCFFSWAIRTHGVANEAKVDKTTEMYFLLSDPFILESGNT